MEDFKAKPLRFNSNDRYNLYLEMVRGLTLGYVRFVSASVVMGGFFI
jgi:hypothetical protein